MRRFGLGMLMLFAVSSSAAAADPQKQPAWLWKNEDRLRERFDPDSVRSRTERARSSVRAVPADASAIIGSENPELFFPTELMEYFLPQALQGEPTELQNRRMLFRREIKAAGWDYDSFWRAIEDHGDPYMRVRRSFTDKQRMTFGREPKGAEAEDLSKTLCATRYAALLAAREEFGEEAFNRFLYTAVAPQLKTWYGPAVRGNELLRMEEGCK